MIILGIETSCDETALSLTEGRSRSDITVLANKILSQVKLHREYGGVFPNLAKREHSKNLIPLFRTALEEASFGNPKHEIPACAGAPACVPPVCVRRTGRRTGRSAGRQNPKQIPKLKSEILNAKRYTLNAILAREPELLEQFLEFIPTIPKPSIDAIAVTVGPGLEPCLWTGVNFAKALSLAWEIPVVPVNHMEGHIFSALLRAEENSNNQTPNSPASRDLAKRDKQIPNHKSQITNKNPTSYQLKAISYPALALLISGGHTELVLVKKQFDYEIIGETRDDAVGEAFDKVARLLGLPYPGGPEISRLAEEVRRAKQGPTLKSEKRSDLVLPRPMLHSGDLDFSFSGIKTAVLYLLKKLEKERRERYPRESAFSISDNLRLRMEIAREFEDAVTEVLIAKTKRAIEEYGAKTLLIGGGVIANTHIRRAFEDLANTYGRKYSLQDEFLYIPEPELATDNALMIAVAGYATVLNEVEGLPALETIRADGTASISTICLPT